MARPREFDANEALQKATELFWTHGMDATSMDQIASETGVKKQSLYGAFGDKQDLLLACLDLYSDQTAEITVRLLESDSDPFKALKQALLGLAPAPRASAKGCFVAQTSLLAHARDPKIKAKIEHFHARLRRLLKEKVIEAQKRKQIRQNLNPDAVAYFLLNNISGFRVTERLDSIDKRLAGEMVELILSSLR